MAAVALFGRPVSPIDARPRAARGFAPVMRVPADSAPHTPQHTTAAATSRWRRVPPGLVSSRQQNVHCYWLRAPPPPATGDGGAGGSSDGPPPSIPARRTPAKAWRPRKDIGARRNSGVVGDAIWDARPRTLQDMVDCLRPSVPGFTSTLSPPMATSNVPVARLPDRRHTPTKLTAAAARMVAAGQGGGLSQRRLLVLSWGRKWFKVCFLVRTKSYADDRVTVNSAVEHATVLGPEEEARAMARSKHSVFRSMERALTLAIQSYVAASRKAGEQELVDFTARAVDLPVLLRCVSWLTRCCSAARLQRFVKERQLRRQWDGQQKGNRAGGKIEDGRRWTATRSLAGREKGDETPSTPHINDGIWPVTVIYLGDGWPSPCLQ